MLELPSSNTFEIMVNAGLRADAEEEKGSIFCFKDAMLRELRDIGDKRLLRSR